MDVHRQAGGSRGPWPVEEASSLQTHGGRRRWHGSPLVQQQSSHPHPLALGQQRLVVCSHTHQSRERTRKTYAGSSTRRQSLCRWPRFRLQFTYSKYLLKIVLLRFQFVHLYSFEKQDIHVHARSNNTASLLRPYVWTFLISSVFNFDYK